MRVALQPHVTWLASSWARAGRCLGLLSDGVLAAGSAGMAVAVASAVAVAPIGPRPSEHRVASPAIRLADSDSILNIPVNLFNDLASVPYNEVQALDQLAESLLFGGSWVVGSSTNLWGADPGDPTHFEALTNLLMPFTALSGPLGQDLAILDEAELPATAACSVADCSPLIPAESVTGISSLDQALAIAQILLGRSFPVFDDWFKVPLTGPDSLTTGYTFGDVSDPGGSALSGFGFDGTSGADNLMPWANTTVQLTDPLQSFWNSLLAAPTGIESASSADLYHALIADLAGAVIAFDPFVPGGPWCHGTCDLPSYLNLPALVKDISALDPGNTLINQWLNNPVNGPTAAQIAFSEQSLQTGIFDLSPTATSQVDSMLSAISPVLPAIADDSGLLGAYDPTALDADFSQLLTEVQPLLNIPVNLLEDVANIPYVEVQNLNELANSLFFSASWIVGNATNIWGADPGDPTHFEVFTQLLMPFPALSVPLGEDLAILDEAELPVSAACATAACDPVVPLESITGITFIDKLIWSGAILGGYPFPLLDSLFKVPLTGPDSLSTGYTFGDVTDPAGPVFSGFGFEGTHDSGGVDNLLPWADTTVQFNNPLESFWDSLIATPTGILSTNGSDLYDAVMAYTAGLIIDFDPFVPGSPLCPATCDLPEALTYPALVQDIYSLDPGNTLIKEWLDGYAAGTINGSTPDQIAYAEQNLQGGFLDLNPDTVAQIDSWLSSINPELAVLANNGLLGPSDPSQFLPELAQLVGLGTAYSDLNTWVTQFSDELDSAVQSALQELATAIQQGVGSGLDALSLLLGLGTALPAYLLSLL